MAVVTVIVRVALGTFMARLAVIARAMATAEATATAVDMAMARTMSMARTTAILHPTILVLTLRRLSAVIIMDRRTVTTTAAHPAVDHIT
jgi:hypothetical protein